MASPQILIVDDERDMLNLLAKVLTKKAGCAVTTVTSAEEALERVRGACFDAVLTDIEDAGHGWPDLSPAGADPGADPDPPSL